MAPNRAPGVEEVSREETGRELNGNENAKGRSATRKMNFISRGKRDGRCRPWAVASNKVPKEEQHLCMNVQVVFLDLYTRLV